MLQTIQACKSKLELVFGYCKSELVLCSYDFLLISTHRISVLILYHLSFGTAGSVVVHVFIYFFAV